MFWRQPGPQDEILHLETLADAAGFGTRGDIPVREHGERIVRLAQIEIYPESLEKYLAFAKEVGTVSMAAEPGVIGLFSMQDKSNPCKVYILEVYADQDAYQAHLQTAHFKNIRKVRPRWSSLLNSRTPTR